jgi:ATP-binding cassette subfamily A (ABC1) protein 3
MSYQPLEQEPLPFTADHASQPSPTTSSSFKQDMKQLNLLVWKNWSLQKRAVISTLIELLVPAVFAIILLPIRHIVPSNQYTNDTTYPPFSIDRLPKDLQPAPDDNFYPSNSDTAHSQLNAFLWSLAYQPNNSALLDKIMTKVRTKVRVNVQGFASEQAMVDFLMKPENFKFNLGGVSFTNPDPENFEYKIRFSYSPRYSGQFGLFKRDMDWKTYLIYWLFPILGMI